MTTAEFELLPLRSRVSLTDGREGIFICAWYAKGKGGRRVMIELPDGKAIQVGLKQLHLLESNMNKH